MEEENITSNEETLSEEESLDGEQEAVSETNEETTQEKQLLDLSLDELNETLGKNFPTKEAALKSIKDTYSYVGKKKVVQKSDNNSLETEKRLRDLEFYTENPEYKPHRDLIAKFGDNPAEVVNDSQFKSVYEKIVGYEKTEKSKSVLKSNPRIGKATDKLSSAREKVSSGNYREAEDDAVSAVMDAYDM